MLLSSLFQFDVRVSEAQLATVTARNAPSNLEAPLTS